MDHSSPQPGMTVVHVVGGGLSGLSAALTVSDQGKNVSLYEGSSAFGGRCRSYDDRELGCRLDNGNHLLLSGNSAAFSMIDRIGSRQRLFSPPEPMFPFHDLATGESWTLRPNNGCVPWWLFSPARRVPGTRPSDYLALRRFLHAGPRATVRQVMSNGPLFRRLIEPLAIASLNASSSAGSAALLGAVMRDTLARGGKACLATFPREGWSEALADPAVASLLAAGQRVASGRRISEIVVEGGRAIALREPGRLTEVKSTDCVILAVPAERAATLMPGLATPSRHESIVNLHFKTELAGPVAGFLGLIGGLAEWLFFKPGIVSVTISAANRLADTPNQALAARVWREIQSACQVEHPQPPYRVVREKRATFAATPEQEHERPSCRTWLPNVFLSGDWTATGLPGTIEGAIRSGRVAGEMVTSAG